MLNTVGKTTTPNYQHDQITHTKSFYSPDNRAPQLSDQLTSSSVPETKSRKIARALLIPVRMLAASITVPVCAALECLAGMSIGIILGSSLIMKSYDNKGLILAMPVSTIVYPMSIIMGAGFAIAGCFLGMYDGFHLGWNFDKSFLANRGNDVKNHLDSFLNKGHQSTVEENVQYKQTIPVNDSSSPYPQNKAIGFVNVSTRRPAASRQVCHNRAGLNAKPPGKIFTSFSAHSAHSATITGTAAIVTNTTHPGISLDFTDSASPQHTTHPGISLDFTDSASPQHTTPPGISLDFTDSASPQHTPPPGISLDFTDTASPQPIADNMLPDSKQRQSYDPQKNPFEKSETATITDAATVTDTAAIVTNTTTPGNSLDVTTPQPIADNMLPDSKQRQSCDTQETPF